MNFEEMMNTMMEKMMETMMTSMMNKMMNSMQTMVSPAEVEEKPVKQVTPKLTKEEFLALDFGAEKKSLAELDLVPVEGSYTVCKYTGYVPKDVWTINHIAITQKYGAKWSKKAGGYKFESAAAMQNFLAHYQIKTELTDVDRHNIKVWNQERAQAKAEYYSKKAQE